VAATEAGTIAVGDGRRRKCREPQADGFDSAVGHSFRAKPHGRWKADGAGKHILQMKRR